MRTRVAIVLLVIVATSLAPARPASAADEPKVDVLGLRILERDAVLRMAGRGPRSCADRGAWAKGAARRIVREYRKRGYRYARVWWDTQDPCTVRLEVDEGRMHRVVFVGVGAYKALLMRVDVNLPHDVFHGPTLDKAVAELKAKHGLQNAYYRVREPRQEAETELGGPGVPQRVLKVFVLTRESFGWTFAVELDSKWGVVPSVGFTFRDVLLEDDRVHADAAIAIPYREYFFQESPALQWVHGEVGGSYRFPPFLGGHVAPLIEASTAVSQYHRDDIGLERFFIVRTPVALLAQLLFPVVTVSLGGGIDHAFIFLIERAGTDDAPDSARDMNVLRYTALLQAEFTIDPDILRRDQRDEVDLSVRFASSGEGDWMVDSRLAAQVWFYLGMHDLLFRARGIYMTGDVRFWDEVGLAGSYQRVFFDNRYWVREAGQLTVAARFSIWEDTIKLGVFHDGSVFVDRTTEDHRIGLTNAFGPSFHWLMFDLFAFDLYYGFGFDRHGFDHALSFELRTVF